MHGDLVSHGARRDEETRWRAARTDNGYLGGERQRTVRQMPFETRKGTSDGILLEKSAPDGLGGIDDERVRFSQRKQAKNMVEIAVRQDDGRDGRMTRGLGVQLFEGFDLTQDIGRT